MKTEKEITKIVTKHGGKFLNFSRVPTWVSKDKMEGFELVAGTLRTFWIKDEERIYDQPISPGWETVWQEITGKPEQKEEKKPEQVNTPQSVAVPENIPMMPEYLTEALIKKYKELSPEARLLMLQNTDKRYLKTRPGRAGSTYDYVEGHYMHQAANLAFLFQWGSRVIETKTTDTEVIVVGEVWGHINDMVINKASVGQQDIKFRQGTKIPLCLGDDVKAAVTDMEKKGLSKFGIAADVYRGEV